MPPRDASPTVFQLSYCKVNPAFFAARVADVTVRPVLQVVDIANCDGGLVRCVYVVLRLVITGDVFYMGEEDRMSAVRPRLVKVGLFVPRAAVLVT